MSQTSDLIYMPDEVSQLTIRYLEKIKNGELSRGVKFGVGDVDGYLNPIGPGDLAVFLGRPGHGKSAALAHYSRCAAELSVIDKTGEIGRPVIVTAEMAVEEYQIRDISYYSKIDSRIIKSGGFQEWDKVISVAKEIPRVSPIVYFGHSLIDKERRPQITLQNVWRGLEYLRDEKGVAPSLISLDYLQRIKFDGRTRDRRLELSEVVEKSKDMALNFQVPVILACQASRAVDDRMPPIPALSDGLETSAIEQAADSILSFFRPSRVFPIGETIPKTNNLICDETLFYVSVVKQRSGDAGRGFWVYFDPRISKIADLEIRERDLNDY